MKISKITTMTLAVLLSATSYSTAFSAEKIETPMTYDGIDFGIDGGEWILDYECDDPRFEGIGMTETELLEIDTRMDATDCLTAYKAGNLQLREE